MHSDFDLVQRLDIIQELCSGKRVLHLGCTNFPYTEEAIAGDALVHFKLKKVCSELWGIDGDQSGIEILERHGFNNLIRGDLEHLDNVGLDEKFDVILAGEIIEHLANPGFFLGSVDRFMNRNSVLILTTINAYCAFRFLYYGARGRRGSREPVHPDHVAYYSYATLRLLIERSGLCLDHFYFYDVGNEHRSGMRWYSRAVNDIAVRLAPQWADGLFAICSSKRRD